MLQPEPVALLGQFISTIEQSNSPILIGPRGPGDASASGTKLHILRLKPCVLEKRVERGEGRLQQWASADRVPY